MSTIHVSIRLDETTMARVEALAPRFSTDWRTATRSEVIRALILSAVEHFESEERPDPRREVPAAGRAPRGRTGAQAAAPPAAERQAPPGRKGAKTGARKGKR